MPLGLFGALGNIVSTGIGAGVSAAVAKENREWNEKMWHMQNEYNTPVAQMQRLKDAGLNPNLAYGQLASSNAGSVGTGDAYGNREISAQLSKLNIAEAGASLAKAVADIKKTQADTERTKVETENEKEHLDEFRNLRVAEEDWHQQHSAYGEYMRSQGYTYHFMPDGGSYWSKDGSQEQSVLRYRTAGYFFDKLSRELDKLQKNNENIDARTEVTKILKILRGMDIPYLNVRNRWQPWNYGIDAGSKVFNSIVGGYGTFMKSLPKPAPNYNYNTYNTYKNAYYH